MAQAPIDEAECWWLLAILAKGDMRRMLRTKIVGILSLLGLPMWLLGAPAVIADVTGTPILPNLTLHDSPHIGKPIRVTFEVTAMRDFSTVDIEFFVPDGVEWIQGDTMLTTSMEKGEKREFTATVNIIPEYWHTLEGNYQGRFIWAMAKATTLEGKCWRVFSTVMAPSGFVERSSGGTTGLEVLRARNRIGQPSKEEIEDISKAVALPDEAKYGTLASHL